jgi:D-alanyl-D-alanine carboxypeptidase/D-alanyl-D-alanine-endopeptidase (penicillin-binding protein 4)
MEARRRKPGARHLLFVLLVALLAPACAGRPGPVTAPYPPSAPFAAPRIADLQRELDGLFGAPALDRSLWAVMVQSLDSGEVLYRRNSTKLVMPASNMKIVTLAAAAERLGWDYTFETRLLATGPIENGVLSGDLVVVGSGDPSINARGGSPTRVFENWADRLRAAGVTRIDGRIVGDDRAFPDEPLGFGWSWDELGSGDAAPVSALQYNENLAEVVVRPGDAAGSAAKVELRPLESGLTLDAHVTTSAAGVPSDLVLKRLPGSDRLSVGGTIPPGSQEIVETAAVEDPAGFFVRALRAVLIRRGIDVRGEAVGLSGVGSVPDLAGAKVLLSHRSPPLSEIGTVLMKVSQNLYAETMLKTLGATRGMATAEAGRTVVQEVLERWGVPPDAVVLRDGSGLSRYNYVTAETLVRILRQMHRDPRHRLAFSATLPIGGQDGTIARRMKGTRAEGNVLAKTGSLSNVRALSGYVKTLDGELLIFSIIANNFNLPTPVIDGVTDLAVERLANFTLK